MSESNTQDDGQGGLKGAFDKAKDMVGGVVGMASAASAGSHSSQAFVTNACVGDLYEIEAGRLASRRARSESVRALGEMMVEHHTTTMHQMQAALMSSEVSRDLPDLKPATALDNRREGMLKHLQDASDDEFDKTYLDQQRLAHQETITLNKGYAERGDNPQLQSVAIGALPMIERHLKTIERIGHH